jgi:hypothetical protein
MGMFSVGRIHEGREIRETEEQRQRKLTEADLAAGYTRLMSAVASMAQKPVVSQPERLAKAIESWCRKSLPPVATEPGDVFLYDSRNGNISGPFLLVDADKAQRQLHAYLARNGCRDGEPFWIVALNGDVL